MKLFKCKQVLFFADCCIIYRHLGVAQLVAHKTGGLGVAGSSPVTQTMTAQLNRIKRGS